MKRAWIGVLALLAGLAFGQTTDDRYVVKRDATYFQGTCRSGQVGMAPTTGNTFVCVSGQWRRNDLPACSPSAPSGTCDQMSMCLHRPTMILYGCSATNVWTAITGGGSVPTPSEGAYNYSQSFSSQTSVVLIHSLGTPNVLVSCYDSGEIQVLPDSVTIDTVSPYNVTVNFTTAQTGRCVVNGSGNGTSGGGGGGSGEFTDLREDGASRVNNAEYIDFLTGFDVSSLGQVSLDYAEKPINLASSEVSGTLSIARGGTGSTSFTSNTCVRYDGTRLVSAATDCSTGGGGSSCTDVDNDCRADVAEGLDCTSSPCVSLNSETSGVLGVPQGGTGLTLAYTDSVLMGQTSVAWGPEAIPDCDASTEKLMYDASDTGPTQNSWYCGTDYYDASGSPPQGPEGAIQFYEGGALGSNAALYWTEATGVLTASSADIDTFRGRARFDADSDGTYDIELANDTPYTKNYIGFRQDASYIRWPTFAMRPNGINYLQLDFTVGDGTDSAIAGDFCIRQNGIDSDCNGAVDFNPLPAPHDVMVGNASLSYTNRSMPDCDGTESGNSLNYSTTSGTFSCRTITGGGSSWALGLDYGADGTNVQVDVDGTTVDLDPDADGTLEARINADGSIETFGAADEAGGLGSNGQLIFTADDNNNDTGEGMAFDFDGDGTYELSAASTGTLTMTTGAVIPGVCASITPAATITATDCNVAVLASGSTPISTINTCNGANTGRQLTVLCGAGTPAFNSGGNLKFTSAFTCTSNDTFTWVCDGTNWLEVARAVNP